MAVPTKNTTKVNLNWLNLKVFVIFPTEEKRRVVQYHTRQVARGRDCIPQMACASEK
jgi:hypothetical protein